MQYDDNSHTESDDEYMHTIYHSESHYWQGVKIRDKTLIVKTEFIKEISTTMQTKNFNVEETGRNMFKVPLSKSFIHSTFEETKVTKH